MAAAKETVAGESAGPSAGVVTRLREHFDTGLTRDLAWRETQLRGIERLLAERESDLIEALVADLRRTDFEAVLLDLAATKAEAVHARKHLREWMRPRPVKAPINVKPGKAWYQYEPLGVVLVIGPWNYPIHLTLTPLLSALAAGNCAVVKPSELTPASSAVLAKLLPDYVDPAAVAIVEGGADVTQDLIGQACDHIFFTGSPGVGAKVMEAAAPHLTPVTLELGGKCPAIVTSSAKLDVTARRLAFGKLVNSGQTCVAPDYVLVNRTVRDEFVATLSATVAKFNEGKAQPVLNPRHAQRLFELLTGSGGETVLGGVVDVEAAMVEPTLVVDPEPGSPILTEEIFGPLFPIVATDSLEESIAHVRGLTSPLATYLFTEDDADEEQVLAKVRCGATVVNHVMMHMAVADLPFGGVGNSGMGNYHGRWGFETFSYPKAVLRKPSKWDLQFIYPPYSKRVEKIMRSMM